MPKLLGKCEPIQAWVGQVRGRMDQTALYETQNGGKFWLRDGKSFIQVYVQGASAEDLRSLYTQVVKGLEVTVTGKAVAVEMRTQFKCKKAYTLRSDRQRPLIFNRTYYAYLSTAGSR